MSGAMPKDMRPRKAAGGRPVSHAIQLTIPEFELLGRQLSKRATLLDTDAGKKSSPKLRMLVASINDKLVEKLTWVSTDQETVDMEFSRDELIIVHTLVKNQVDGLNEKVIPAYAARGLASSARGKEAADMVIALDKILMKVNNVIYNSDKRRNSQYGKR